jgi:biotin transport system substrate-specific component
VAVYEKEAKLAGIAIPSAYSEALHRVGKILAFALFTTVGAQLAVPLPFTPVPITMQTLFVVLAGVTLGPRDGFYAMLSYLALGFSGAPVFSGFSFGPGVLLGPTGGYLVAFPAAALLSGYVVGRLGIGRVRVFIASACGMALILFAGAAYLKLISGASLDRIAAMAVLPFVAGEVVKALVAAGIAGKSERA